MCAAALGQNSDGLMSLTCQGINLLRKETFFLPYKKNKKNAYKRILNVFFLYWTQVRFQQKVILDTALTTGVGLPNQRSQY